MILGILASSITKSKLVTNSYESIATATVGAGGVSGVSFSSIPSTYQHLQLRLFFNTAGANNYSLIKINSDSTDANYYVHYLYGNGSTVTAGAASSNRTLYFNYPTTSNQFGVAVIDFLDYISVDKYKTIRTLAGYDSNGSGLAEFSSNLWKSTSAINRIDIDGASNLAQYSHAALYGIKA